jgi:asparagine synthase (glutamine-hydrolysing)
LRAFSPLSKPNKYIKRASLPLPDRIFSYSFLSTAGRESIFSDGFLASVNSADPLAPARAHYGNAGTTAALNRWLYLDLKMILGDNDLRKVTRMAELAGVIPRYPLLDRELAEFSGRIPPDLKVKGGQLRYIFKRAMADLLPKDIIEKKKHGFGLPFSVWVGEHSRLKDLTFDILGSERCRERGYLRPGFLEWIWGQYESVHRVFFGDSLWVFLMLELWFGTAEDARS